MAYAQPKTLLAGAIVSTVLLGALPVATVQGHDDDDHKKRSFKVRLISYEEVPALSTGATGEFRLRVNRDQTAASYELIYSNLESAVTQAHIHFGQKGVNGGISVFLCSNLGNGPAGTQACPGPLSGAVSGTFSAADVVGPGGQGIAAGQFAELIKAIQAGITYANVHTTGFPGGEIRAQLK